MSHLRSFVIWSCVGLALSGPVAQQSQSPLIFEPIRTEDVNNVVRPINNMIKRVQDSETASAIEDVTRSVGDAVGNFTKSLGSLFVATLKQLPGTVDQISRAVNDVVTDGSEKMVIMVRGIQDGHKKQNSNQISEKVDKQLLNTAASSNSASKPFLNTEVQESLQNIQDQFALTIGRILAIAYKNADQIDTAVASTLRKVTGLERNSDARETSALQSSSRSNHITQPGDLSSDDIRNLFRDIQ